MTILITLLPGDDMNESRIGHPGNSAIHKGEKADLTVLDATDLRDDGTYASLIAMLDDGGARYRLIDHQPEGRTEAVSMIRGHGLSQAAKCMVLRIRLSKKSRRYVLAVVPGDRRVDLNLVGNLFGGK